ncbi:MAG: phosphatase PAP2 family protein [Clostridia bacterium]|nr:phosphatase PAP2 family protein [Clostridia bacterium]
MQKKTIIGISVGVVVFVALLLVATFFDLQISVALGNADSLFGQFFRLWGEVTAWILIPIAGAIFFAASDKNLLAGKIMKIVWAVVIVVGWYLTVSYFMEEFTGDSYREGLFGSPYNTLIIYDICFALLASGATIFCVSKVKKETISKLVTFAAVMLIALALSQLVTTVMKTLWSRQRFRNMDIGNGGTDASGFTPWYVVGLGKNKAAATYYVDDSAGMLLKDAYKSFPSGHTCAAAMAYVIIMLPDIFEKLKKYKVWFYVVPLVYTVLVAISRIVNRAHFMSDVLFGGTIGILSVYAAIGIVNLVKKLYDKDNKFFVATAKVFGIEKEVIVEEVAGEEILVEEEQVTLENCENSIEE